MKEIIHQRRRLPNGSSFYTGMAKMEIIIRNAEEFELQKWSNFAYGKNFSSHGAIFQCCFLPLVKCDQCTTGTKPHSHHSSICTLAKKPQLENVEKSHDNIKETASEFVIEMSTGTAPCDKIIESNANLEDDTASHVSYEQQSSHADEETEKEPVKKAKNLKCPILLRLPKTNILRQKLHDIKAYPEAKHLIDERQIIRIENADQQSENELIYFENC